MIENEQNLEETQDANLGDDQTQTGDNDITDEETDLDELSEGDDDLLEDEETGGPVEPEVTQPAPQAIPQATVAPLEQPAPPVQTMAAPPPVVPAFQSANQTGLAARPLNDEREFGIKYGKRQAAVKDRLDKQPKVTFMIPKNPLEIDSLAYETVQIDGFRMEIRKGVMVQIPEQVAHILAEKFNIETTAGSDMMVGRSQEAIDSLN